MSKKKHREIPQLGHAIFETHCHLDYLDESSIATTLERAQQVGVDRCITIAVSPDNLQSVMQICQRFDQVWGTQGIHPHEAEHFNADVAARIRDNLSNEKILAVGEIGLDYYYDHADRNVQQRVFEEQLQIAVDADMPVVIHTREAEADTMAILRNFQDSLRGKGVIHSFTSSVELAAFCLDQGYHLGFNGITTFNKAENVRDVVRMTPLERILLETDAPYLTPVPYRGRPNAPFYLPFIAEKIAEVKDVPVATLLLQAYENSQQVFFRT